PQLDEDFVHHDGPSEPGVPPITDFPELGIVGVELSTSITTGARTSRWTRMRQSRERSNRQPAARSCQFHTSPVYITTTNLAPPELPPPRGLTWPDPPVIRAVVRRTAPRSSDKASQPDALGSQSRTGDPRTHNRRLHTVRMEFLVGTTPRCVGRD